MFGCLMQTFELVFQCLKIWQDIQKHRDNNAFCTIGSVFIAAVYIVASLSYRQL